MSNQGALEVRGPMCSEPRSVGNLVCEAAEPRALALLVRAAVPRDDIPSNRPPIAWVRGFVG